MAQKEDIASTTGVQDKPAEHNGRSRGLAIILPTSGPFLPGLRTGLATITFGFVVERFGLLLRELGLKSSSSSIIPAHYSSIFGVSLTLLGVIMMIVALLNFLHNRRSIMKRISIHTWVFAVLLTVIASLIGTLLAIYLVLTA